VPDASLRTRVIAALAICFAVEISQRYQLPVLEALQHSFAGHLVLGSGFDPRDCLSYTLGVLAATLLGADGARASSARPSGLTRAGFSNSALHSRRTRLSMNAWCWMCAPGAFAERAHVRAPRVHWEFRDEGIRVGRKRTARLMRRDGLAGRAPRRVGRWSPTRITRIGSLPSVSISSGWAISPTCRRRRVALSGGGPRSRLASVCRLGDARRYGCRSEIVRSRWRSRGDDRTCVIPQTPIAAVSMPARPTRSGWLGMEWSRAWAEAELLGQRRRGELLRDAGTAADCP